MGNYVSKRSPEGVSIGTVCPGELVLVELTPTDNTLTERSASSGMPIYPSIAIDIPQSDNGSDDGGRWIVDPGIIGNAGGKPYGLRVLGGDASASYSVAIRRWRPEDPTLLRREYTLTYYAMNAATSYAIPRGARSLQLVLATSFNVRYSNGANIAVAYGGGFRYSLGALGAASKPDGGPHLPESAASGASLIIPTGAFSAYCQFGIELPYT